ncbi:MAG: chromate resistance exported protein [Cellvibrio sp.]|jgi:hypothetical protein|nr:chromate resistance exported protein [Cellvibrio sp.]
MNWLLLILTLPTSNTTARMRVWRGLKGSGAAVLRDGVYLIPASATSQAVFDEASRDVIANGGSAYIFATDTAEAGDLSQLFDRREDYLALQNELQQLSAQLTGNSLQEAFKQLRKLRKNFTAITAIDFFPGASQAEIRQALQALEVHINRLLSPDEPKSIDGDIARRDLLQYQNRTWATRKRPWVDRLASAWLIKKFIDPNAHFLWLDAPDQCPPDALGFDFDNADFTHVGDRVSFEVLLASFGLNHPELTRMGTLVHYLDVGGVQPMEASGLEQILWGLRNSIADDDQLIAAAGSVFDALLAAFTHKEKA